MTTSSRRNLRAATFFFSGLIACLCLLLASAEAKGAFGIESYSVDMTDPSGEPLHQVGAHADMTTRFQLATKDDGHGPIPDGDLKHTIVDLPRGFYGNPGAVPRCSTEEFADLLGKNCAVSSQVGITTTFIGSNDGPDPVGTWTSPVYNLTPGKGEIAAFGFYVVFVPVRIVVTMPDDGDYNVRASVSYASRGANVFGQELTIWGVPADPAHDAERYSAGPFSAPGASSGTPPTPFLTLPSTCQAFETKMRMVSWQGEEDTASHLSGQPTGCEKPRFAPDVGIQPTSRTPGAPTGLDVDVELPQNQDSKGIGSPPLEDAVVTLPEGMSINPSSAQGLVACTDADLKLGGLGPAACPDAAKIGSVEVDTPVLEEPITGGVYLRPQASQEPQSGEMFRLTMALQNEERGISVRLLGQVRVDPATGRIQTTFADNPQLPVERIRLRLKSGERAPLVNPTGCGPQPATARLSSWGGPSVQVEDTFDLACPGVSRFQPEFEAGALNPRAGAFSPLLVRVSRGDADQEIKSIESVTLPAGLLARLASVPLCPEHLAATGSCGPDSRVGGVEVAAGAGSNPLWVPQAGKRPTSVHLAGPYKGAPYSLVVVVPAQAGPFDLGTVAVRVALAVDPRTARVTAYSDPLPHILGGVPLKVRDIRLRIDRDRFTLNPTSCRQKSVAAQLVGLGGARAEVSSPFRAANCADLGFKPKLRLTLAGAMKRGGHPALTAVLKARPGDANIGRVAVTLPRSAFLAQDHIRTVCTRVQFAAEACPEASIYGFARAMTPLLDRPLEGPVYLRSSSNPLPDLVADLEGQIGIELVGRIDSANGGIRATFDSVPDAPVSRFTMRMKGGQGSLIENSTGLCRLVQRATIEMVGQNGRSHDTRPEVREKGCGKKAGKGKRR